ncbi:hypothetical protein ACF0H5_009155 [Mactra antiquata]
MSSTSGVLNTPQSTIGAQELIAVGRCTKMGFLRHEGRMERMFKFKKWRQRFVALSRGCIYIFSDEMASKPMVSCSLKIFNKCERIQLQNTIWPFRIVSTDGHNIKCLQFSCMSDPDRKSWMQQIKQGMILAHNVPKTLVDKEEGNQEDYVYLEKPIPKKEEPKPQVPTILEETEDIGGEEDYQTIDENMIAEIVVNSQSTPNYPGNSSTFPANNNKNITTDKKVKASTLPEDARMKVSRSAFEYSGSDRSEVEKLLCARPEGTYLVRKSRSDGNEVLSVNVEGVLKEFKIYNRDGGATINNEDYFTSVEELIKYYVKNVLPKKSTKLYLAYSVTDPRYLHQ